MTDWHRVKWSEARQVLDLLGEAGETMPAPDGQTPSAYFDRLRADARLAEAAKFLGQALPRLETVAWAARSVRDLSIQDSQASRANAPALRAALLWVGDPTENRRRAAHAAAEACDSASPERLAAMAAFFSGGSIAPPECAVLPAPREAAGLFASGAVLSAAARTGDMPAALDKALDLGAGIASRGVEPATA